MNEHSFIFAAVMRTRDENKEAAIREKAVKMITKGGLNGLSMQKLAKEANVSPATIYIYFKDREDLILQLWIEAFHKMAAATLKNFDPSMSFAEGLKIQWINRARYFMKYPEQVDFMEQIRHSPVQGKAVSAMGDSFKETMHAFVKNAIANGELVKVSVEVYWSVAFAPMYNLVKFHNDGTSLAGRPFKLTDKTLNEAFELVLKALRP